MILRREYKRQRTCMSRKYSGQGLAYYATKFLEFIGLAQENPGQFGMVASHDVGLVIAAGQA